MSASLFTVYQNYGIFTKNNKRNSVLKLVLYIIFSNCVMEFLRPCIGLHLFRFNVFLGSLPGTGTGNGSSWTAGNAH